MRLRLSEVGMCMNASCLTASCRASALVLVVAAMSALGPKLRSDVVWFENPPPGAEGHYDWHMGSIDDPGIWLDFTCASTDQPGQSGPTTVSQYFNPYHNWWRASTNDSLGGAMVGVDQFVVAARPYGAEISEHSYFWGWFPIAQLAVGYEGFTWTEFWPGERQYFGVRFEDTDGLMHNGWVGVIRTSVETEMELDAFAWAYETTPEASIYAGVIPAPAGLVVLAGAAIRPWRRRGVVLRGNGQ